MVDIVSSTLKVLLAYDLPTHDTHADKQQTDRQTHKRHKVDLTFTKLLTLVY